MYRKNKNGKTTTTHHHPTHWSKGARIPIIYKHSIFHHLLYTYFLFTLLFSSPVIHSGLLRLQQIYQGLKPGNESFQVEMVKRIANVSMAIDFLHTLETISRWSKKYIVLDCPTEMAKQIVIAHVRDITLGRRTYHYLLSGLVSTFFSILYVTFWSMKLTTNDSNL